MLKATAKEVKNNFDKYLRLVQKGEDVIVLENGLETKRMVSHDRIISFLSDELIGILKGDYDDKSTRSKQ